jgi:hypothetical protein
VGATQGAWASWERGSRAPDAFFANAIDDLSRGIVPARGWAFPRSRTVEAQSIATNGSVLAAEATAESLARTARTAAAAARAAAAEVKRVAAEARATAREAAASLREAS